MLKLKAFSILESMIALSMLSIVMMVLSMIFFNVIKGSQSQQVLKAQGMVNKYKLTNRELKIEGYDLIITYSDPFNWTDVIMISYQVRYDGREVLTINEFVHDKSY